MIRDLLRVVGARVFFNQKTEYELRIRDWSSDVCSSDLHPLMQPLLRTKARIGGHQHPAGLGERLARDVIRGGGACDVGREQHRLMCEGEPPLSMQEAYEIAFRQKQELRS